MLDLTVFHTHELERLWLAPATPEEERHRINEEIQAREAGQRQPPLVGEDPKEEHNGPTHHHGARRV